MSRVSEEEKVVDFTDCDKPIKTRISHKGEDIRDEWMGKKKV